jgi:hypothetical protein
MSEINQALTPIKSAIISTSCKDGIDVIAKYLASHGVLIYSTGETAKYLKSIGVTTTSVESLTEFPEMLGGRVKTMHPKVLGGILARRDKKSDIKEITKHGIPSIDLVIIDLYPFEETVENNSSHEDILESIDIGGSTLIRAAAKNYHDVLVVSDRSQYDALMEVLGEECASDLHSREEFAIEAFAKTFEYDKMIFKYLLAEDEDQIESDGNSSDSNVNLNLSVTKDDYNLNDFIYCWEKFGERPNKIVVHNTYSTKLFNKLMEDKILSKNVFTEVIPDSVEVIINDKILAKIDDTCYLSYIIADRNMDNSFIDSITFYYKSGHIGLDDILTELNDCILDYCEEDSNKLNTIILSVNGLELEPLSIDEDKLEHVDLYYSADTYKSIQKTIKTIKKADKGLTILHGERGTGKTSIIEHIASSLDRISIYIPGSMIDHTINNPEFRKFVKKYERPVLFIDDCETLVGDMYRQSAFVPNALQMVEGFLSDAIGANIVMIFNEKDEDNIDEDLLECNTLLEVVSFGELSEDEASELAKHLGRKGSKGKARVIDVVKKRKSSTEAEIGF